MNSEKKEQIFKAFLSLAAVGTSVAFAPTGPVLGIIKDLFKNLAPGWAAQFSVEALMPWVKRKWLTEPNPLINHHINNSLILSWKTALDKVLREYSEKKDGLYGQEAESLPVFINMLKDISDDEFLKRLNEDLHQEEIFKYLSPDNAEIESYLNKRFDLDKKLNPFSEEYYLTQDFIDFFKERVPALMSFYFRADLKKGKEAKQAVDLLYQETIREAVNVISTKQEEQLRILNELQGKINKLTNIDDFAYTVLVTSIQNVQNEILQELAIIRENTIKIINLLNVKPSLSYNDESEEPNPGTLFSYKQKYTAFTGREKELNDLQNFIDDSRKFCWLTMLGPGGIGKSRLALEITEIARTQQFHSGFLYNFKSFNWITWTPLIDTFIVIDYAYSNYQEVFDLIKLFREKDKQKELNFKIRLLLLDRDLREDWKINIKNTDEIRNSNFLKNTKEDFYVLQPLQNDQRWQIIQEIINKSDLTIKEKKELLKSETEIINKLNIIDPKQRPLFAFFTGIALVHENGMQNIENWNADDLIDHHLQRIEEGVWKKIEGYKGNEEAIKKLIAINTLCRELSASTAHIVSHKLNIDSTFLKNSYFLITENKKNNAGYVEKYYGIQPDILGEYFIIKMMNEIESDPGKDNKEWLDLYQYAVELSASKVYQTLKLLIEDFKFFDPKTLPDFTELIAEYDKLIQKSPDNYFYFSERGVLKINCKLYESALEDFNKSIKLNSNNNISYYRRGALYYELNKFEDAINNFNIAIQTYPDWAEPYAKRGYSKFVLNQIEAAIEDYNEAIELEPDNFSYYNYRGNAYHYLGQYEQAIKDYSKAIKINPDKFICYRNRGGSNKQLGNYNDAINDLNVAIKLNPKDSIAYKERGQLYFKINMFDDALNDYSKAIEIEPEDAKSFNERGNIYYDCLKYLQAIADYSKAIEISPQNPVVFNNRANAKRALGNYREAIEDYTKAIELNPNSFIYYNDRGLLNTFEEAIKDFTKALELKPDDSGILYNRAYAKQSLGKYQEAIEDYTKALELMPDDPGILYNRAYAKQSLGKYQEAIEDYNKAIELYSNDFIYYNDRGLAQMALNNSEEAIEDYTKALELMPDDPCILYNRAYAKHSLGKYQEAIEDYNKAIELYPNDFIYHSDRGLAQEALNNFEEAIEDYSKAIKLVPGNADLYSNRAYAKEALNKYEEAIEDYSKAIENESVNAGYYNDRGYVLNAIAKYEDAINDFNSAIKIDPDFSNAYKNCAFSFYNLKQFKNALDSINKAINLNSNYTEAYTLRGKIHIALNEKELACESFNKATEMNDDEGKMNFEKFCIN